MEVEIDIVEVDYPSIREVDSKLVEMAKRFKGELLTTDYNLNKVAKVQKIHVLNINDLANAMRPQVLPGERFNIFIKKPGKENEQGVGYMPDGTMVVVEDGRNDIGRTKEIGVTTVLQTSAGRIIFGRIHDK